LQISTLTKTSCVVHKKGDLPAYGSADEQELEAEGDPPNVMEVRGELRRSHVVRLEFCKLRPLIPRIYAALAMYPHSRKTHPLRVPFPTVTRGACCRADRSQELLMTRPASVDLERGLQTAMDDASSTTVRRLVWF
jgi:hypothetical protein